MFSVVVLNICDYAGVERCLRTYQLHKFCRVVVYGNVCYWSSGFAVEATTPEAAN